ncbi:MAG: terminase TerL endonuclease subunit [Acidobacteriota bacterium]
MALRQSCRGLPVYGGLDLSRLTDLTALVLITTEEPIAAMPWIWVPGEDLEGRSERDRVPYVQWVEAGLIETMPGEVIDEDLLEQRILDIVDDYELIELAFDPYNAMRIAPRLAGEGLPIVEVRQGFYLSPACKRLEAMVVDGKIRHAGHPVLRSAAEKTAIATDQNGNIRPIKIAKRRHRIDPIVALLMAIQRWSVGDPAPGRSVYEEEWYDSVASGGAAAPGSEEEASIESALRPGPVRRGRRSVYEEF